MHYLYFTRVSKEEAETSEEARQHAETTLNEQGFNSTGYFTQSKSDWFVVGGRWSGHLTNLINGNEFFKLIKENKKFNPKQDPHFYFTNYEKHAKEVQKIWEDYTHTTTPNPYARDSYTIDGAEDDAMRITPELITALQKHHAKPTEYGDTVECFDAVQYEEYPVADLDTQAHEEEYLNDWLVVIDYHN